MQTAASCFVPTQMQSSSTTAASAQGHVGLLGPMPCFDGVKGGTQPRIFGATTQLNNWPSMGDLKNKFIIVLTGNGDKVSQYIADQRGVASLSPSCTHIHLVQAPIIAGIPHD